MIGIRYCVGIHVSLEHHRASATPVGLEPGALLRRECSERIYLLAAVDLVQRRGRPADWRAPHNLQDNGRDP